MAHEEKRFVCAPVLQEVDGEVRDDISDVALNDVAAIRVDKRGIEINALAGQDFPIVKTGRVAAQMPFADHASVIAGSLEILGDGRLGAVEPIERGNAVQVAVFAGEDRGPAGAADRIDAKAIFESHAGVRQAIQVRRLVHAAPVGADRVRRVVVAHDEEDVRAGRVGSGNGQGGREQQRGHRKLHAEDGEQRR